MRYAIAIVGVFAVANLCHADVHEQRDPRWWFRRAEAALERVEDPEARTIIGSMLRTVQGKTLSPAQASAAVDEQLAVLRAKTPADKTWQYELNAARLYESVARYPEALASFKRAKLEIKTRFEGKFRENLLTNVDYPLRNLASEALKRDDLEVATQAVELIHAAPTRETEQGDICVAMTKHGRLEDALAYANQIPEGFRRDRAFTNIADVVDTRDPELAIQLLQHVPEAARPQAERLFLIRRSTPKHPDRLAAAIERLIDDADTTTDQELWRCLSNLEGSLTRLKAKPPLTPELATSFEAFLKQSVKSRARAKSEALQCLAQWYFLSDHYDAALDLLRRHDAGHLLAVYQQKIAFALLERRQTKQAFEVCRDIRGFEPSLDLTKAFVKAGDPVAALHLVKKRDDLDTAALVMTDIAEAFATNNDTQGVQNAIESLSVDDLKVRCLADLAGRLHAKDSEAAIEYLEQARKLLDDVKASPRRFEAVQAVARAQGVTKQAAAVAIPKNDRQASNQLLSHLSIAESKLAAGDDAAFMAEMRRFEQAMTDEAIRALADEPVADLPRRRSSTNEPETAPAPLPTTTKATSKSDANKAVELAQMRMQLASLGFSAYMRAGKAAEARRVWVNSASAAQKVGGTLWRIEQNMELIEYFKTEKDLEELAALAEAMESPVDKATLFTLGGGVLAKLQSNLQPTSKEDMPQSSPELGP